MQTTESGLQYKDIVVGDGDAPLVGFQVIYCVSCVSEIVWSNWGYHNTPFLHFLKRENGLFFTSKMRKMEEISHFKELGNGLL